MPNNFVQNQNIKPILEKNKNKKTKTKTKKKTKKQKQKQNNNKNKQKKKNLIPISKELFNHKTITFLRITKIPAHLGMHSILKSIKTKDKLYKKFISKPTTENKLKYTKY